MQSAMKKKESFTHWVIEALAFILGITLGFYLGNILLFMYFTNSPIW